MVSIQNKDFSNFFFLGNIGKENVFYDILERKNVFLEYKNMNFKKSKNGHFFKGVNPSFWSKKGHFSKSFFLGNLGQENVFYDILERKNAFLVYKNKQFKKSKNGHFFLNGLTHALDPKMTIFPIFFFWQYRPGKCLLRYTKTKKHRSRL